MIKLFVHKLPFIILWASTVLWGVTIESVEDDGVTIELLNKGQSPEAALRHALCTDYEIDSVDPGNRRVLIRGSSNLNLSGSLLTYPVDIRSVANKVNTDNGSFDSNRFSMHCGPWEIRCVYQYTKPEEFLRPQTHFEEPNLCKEISILLLKKPDRGRAKIVSRIAKYGVLDRYPLYQTFMLILKALMLADADAESADTDFLTQFNYLCGFEHPNIVFMV